MSGRTDLSARHSARFVGNPYRVLGFSGVTPGSSLREVRAAAFGVMEAGMTPERHAALQDLRRVERRLVIDFFLRTLEANQPAHADAEVPPLPVGWLESFAYPSPEPVEGAEVEHVDPPPYLSGGPSAWASASTSVPESRGDHG